MKQTVLIILFVSKGIISLAQDLINPYQVLSTMPSHSVQDLSISGEWYDLNFSAISYNGEYQILLDQFSWGKTTAFTNFFKSIIIETVSFPFTPHDECAFSATGCVSQNNDRILTMPISPYDALNKSWGELDQFAPLPTEEKNTLSSYGFIRPSSMGSVQAALPHTILKHTIKLHCGPNSTDPVITSISFYYDNTRGRMRYYPFKASNTSPSGPSEYDIVFRPSIISNIPYHSVLAP